MISRTTPRLCRERMQSLMLACVILSGAVVSRTADASEANEVSGIAEITKEIAAEIRRGASNPALPWFAFPKEKLDTFEEFTQRLVNEDGPQVALRNLDYMLDAVALAREERLFPEWVLSDTHDGPVADLVSLRNSLARLTAGDVHYQVLEIETEIQPRDRVIKLVQDGEAHGVVYRRNNDTKTFLGYVPQNVLLHIGDNHIEVMTDTGTHNIYIHSDGSRAIIEKITYDYDSLCCDLVPSEKNDYKRWANTMRGREVVLSGNIPLLQLRKPIPIAPRPPRRAGRHVLRVLKADFGRATFYRLNIISDPEGATIIINEQQYGLTPKSLIIKNNYRQFTLVLLKDGFVDTAVTVDLLRPATEIRAKLALLPVNDR